MLAAALGPIITGVSELKRRADLTEHMRLHIKPAVSTGGGSARSPRAEERLDLKMHFLTCFGLLEPTNNLRCYTHMGGPAVPIKDATLAHIWPSSEADAAGLLAGELRLPRAFHLNPRNFLILPWDVHCAFDSGWLLFIPKKYAGETRVVVRASRVDAVVVHGNPESTETRDKRAWLRSLDGTVLQFKNDLRPFMRVLGWRAWTMRGSPDDDDAASRDAEEASVDVGSVDAEGNRALHSLSLRGLALAGPLARG